jgi:uncharacterized membrane protein
LTIVFLLWIWNSVRTYVLDPVEHLARHIMVRQIRDVHDTVPDGATRTGTRFSHQGKSYVQLTSGEWVPLKVYDLVRRKPGRDFPTTAEALYERYVEIRWLQPTVVVPIFFSVFILLVYLLGKFIAARVGHMLWTSVERFIHHLPFIRTVYGTVKHVTDLAFSEREIEFTRVVAVEYPRKGIWTLAFVTGEGMPPLANVITEPVVRLLVPTSPMPATGFTITVPKSQTIDVNVSVDQAIQLIVSCGFVAPGAHKTAGHAANLPDSGLLASQAISAAGAGETNEVT